MKELRPEGSPDAEAHRKEAEEQHEIDSLRADMRGDSIQAAESLLRRLPEALTEEMKAFEVQMNAFAQHPLLEGWRANLDHTPVREGRLSAALAEALRPLCVATFVSLPPGGFARLSE